jgi:hypothetical protein
VIDS